MSICKWVQKTSIIAIPVQSKLEPEPEVWPLIDYDRSEAKSIQELLHEVN